MDITTTINVPSDAAYFEGHFPGNPILAGVAEVALALEALAEARAAELTLQGITYMRFRQVILPGDRLELVAKKGDSGQLRVDLKRNGRLVANGEWTLAALATGSDEEAAAIEEGSLLSEIPSLDKLLPHRPPMRFLQSIISVEQEALVALAAIPADCPLVADGTVAAVVGLEAAAQAAAAWGALQRSRDGGETAPRVGYLVALREVSFFTDRIPVEQMLRVVVRLDASAPPLSHYRVALYADRKLLAQGMIATFLNEGE